MHLKEEFKQDLLTGRVEPTFGGNATIPLSTVQLALNSKTSVH